MDNFLALRWMINLRWCSNRQKLGHPSVPFPWWPEFPPSSPNCPSVFSLQDDMEQLMKDAYPRPRHQRDDDPEERSLSANCWKKKSKSLWWNQVWTRAENPGHRRQDWCQCAVMAVDQMESFVATTGDNRYHHLPIAKPDEPANEKLGGKNLASVGGGSSNPQYRTDVVLIYRW